jgi:imidazole glycerol-phosphate synthase subunit HisH
MPLPREVVIVRNGGANLASVIAAFTRLNVTTRITEHPADIDTSAALVLPGVGAFGPAMRRLRELKLIDPLRRRLRQSRPTLCICLGMQILASASEESREPDANAEEGLAIFDATIRRFPTSVRVPQLGWNRITPETQTTLELTNNSSPRLLTEPTYVYYANSFRLEHTPPGWHAAITNYAGPFVGALERDGILACQFHPELSGRAGLDLIARWLHRAGIINTSPAAQFAERSS